MSWITELILWVASLCTAATVIAGVVYRLLIKPLKGLIAEMRDDKEFADECDMWTLRMAIVNPSFPDSERLDAFEMYERRGGNGYMKECASAIRRRMQEKINDKIEGEKRC